MKLNPSQTLVRTHYCGGEFGYVKSWQDVRECGDTLLEFLLREAGDADTVEEFSSMLDAAIGQLRSLRNELL